MNSKVSYWGTDFTAPLPYRDPGLGLNEDFAVLLNAIYRPLRIIDETVSGWSVKFRTNRTEQVDAGKSDTVTS